jgi:hypothetical protein
MKNSFSKLPMMAVVRLLMKRIIGVSEDPLILTTLRARN